MLQTKVIYCNKPFIPKRQQAATQEAGHRPTEGARSLELRSLREVVQSISKQDNVRDRRAGTSDHPFQNTRKSGLWSFRVVFGCLLREPVTQLRASRQ